MEITTTHFIETISYEKTYFYIVLELDCFGNKPLKRKKNNYCLKEFERTQIR